MVQSTGRPHVVEGLRLVALVGRGGEGEVWEARDPRGRRRALKLVRPDCLAPPDEAVERGRLLVRIDHPALVRVHRSGLLSGWSDDPGEGGAAERELEGWGFVEMDFVDGPSLATAAADPDVLERLAPLAEALDLLHTGHWSGGVPMIHRDVKPANIVEDADGDLVLVDPSTLRGVDDGQLTRIGTPLFCAPEVMVGEVTPSADVYSFAATIVALATGRRGQDLAEVLREPGAFDLPPGVRQALSPDPAQRPLSCRAVLHQGMAVEAPPQPVPLPTLPTWGDAWEGGTGNGHHPAGSGWEDAPAEAGAWAAGPASATAGTWPTAPAPAGRWPDQRRYDHPAETRRQDAWQDQPPAAERPATWHDDRTDADQRDAWQDQAPPADQRGRATWPDAAAAPGYEAPAETPDDGAHGSALPWMLLSFLLAGAALLARFLEVEPGLFRLTALATIAGHVGAVVVGGLPAVLAVLPPVAWATLVADRLGATTRRRAWAATMLLPALPALTVVPIAVLVCPLLPAGARLLV